MTRAEAITKIIRHLLAIVKVLAIYAGVQAAFPKLFAESAQAVKD